MNKDTQLKTQLINEYATKGIKFVDEKMGEVKNLLDKYVNAIDEKGVITATGDPVFGENASDAMAKATELTVDYAALREVKASLDTAEKYKKLAEQKETDGDVLNPAGNSHDARLLAEAIGSFNTKPLNATNAIKTAIDEGKINMDLNTNKVGSSAELGANTDEGFRILLNVFDHSDYASELLRTGRIQVEPIVQQDMLDILPRQQLPVAGFKWMEEKSITNAGTGGAVAGRDEGGRLAEQGFEYVERTLTLRNAGVRMPIVDEVSNDEPFLIGFLTQRLEALMRKYTSNQVMNGNGTGTNMNGLLSRVVATQVANANQNGFTTASLGTSATYGANAQGQIPAYKVSSNSDAKVALVDLYKASTHIEDVGGEMADYVVLRSGTLASIYTAQDDNNNFIFPQNNFGQNVIPLSGLRYVKDSTLPPNRAIIGSFANNCALGVAGGLVAGIGYDSDDWSRFQRTYRMGARMNLAVFNQNAFVVCYNIVS